MPIDIRKIVASNITARFDEPDFPLTRDLAAESGIIGRRTLGKIEKGEVYAQLDSIQAIAGLLRIEPWRLLAPNLGRDVDTSSRDAIASSPPSVKRVVEAALNAANVPGAILNSISALLAQLADTHGRESSEQSEIRATAKESLLQGSERQKQIAALHREAIQAGDIEAAKVFERLMQMTAPGKRADKPEPSRRATTKG